MALTAPNLHFITASASSFSSSNSSSLFFQIPHKTTQLSCFNSNVGISGAGDLHKSLSFHGKPAQGRGLIVAQATETVAPTSEEQAASPSKSSKKKKAVKYPRRYLDQYQVLHYPIITESAIKNIADENTLLFTVDVRADKKMIRDAVTNLFGVKVRKVNTAIRPDGTKKAHIMLNREDNASDLAKRIGIFPSSD